MSDVPSVPPAGGSQTWTAVSGDGDASAVADDHQVHYVAGHFEMMVDGKPTKLSPLEAVCVVLQNRYLALSDTTAQKTKAMQDQVNQINETNDWLNALRQAHGPDGSFEKPAAEPSASLSKWMADNDVDTDSIGDPPDGAKLDSLESKFTSRVDQLSSTNELKMLDLKTTVNKSQEALAAADGLLQDLKQLMQTITNNMSR